MSDQQNTIDDGGPAFPIPDNHDANGRVQYGSNGMSLRDYAAIHASEADIAAHIQPNRGSGAFSELPKARTRQQARYAHADALIAARKEKL